jgi:ABC-2 type transport system ATP-binding protein
MDIINTENLGKRYRQLEAVKAVSFSVREGEIFGFLGPNGAGKTTTINTLCTLLVPTTGEATVNGYDVRRQRSEVRRSIGLVFQDPTLDEYLTGEQNLRFHAYAYGVPKDIREQRMRDLLTLLELWDRRKHKVRTYSGGMKRRLEIARGLLHHPRVLFLDEPTLGLDPQTRHRIWEYLRDLRARENLTIFLTTHYMDEAENCERIAFIDHGQIVALDTPDNLKNAMGGDVVTLKAEDNELACQELRQRYSLAPEVRNGMVTFSVPQGEEFLPGFVRGFEQRLLSIGVRRPTLDDVFLKLTGHAIRDQDVDPFEQMKRWMKQ